MLLINELKLTTPILGCKQVSGRPRQLLRDREGRPGLVDAVWQKHFEQAAQELDITYSREMVTLPTGYEAGVFEEFLRSYSRFKKERFESIPKGQTIKFECMLMDTMLAPSDFAKILSIVGTQFGLSQFGNRFGFGRFKVELIKREKLVPQLDIGVLDIT